MGPVKDAPLAFCDYFSLQNTDTVAADRVSVDYVGEVYYLQYNKAQQWYFFRDQMPDEVTMFTSFDSKHGQGVACKILDPPGNIHKLTFSRLSSCIVPRSDS
jgi:hypothetical protein